MLRFGFDSFGIILLISTMLHPGYSFRKRCYSCHYVVNPKDIPLLGDLVKPGISSQNTETCISEDLVDKNVPLEPGESCYYELMLDLQGRVFGARRGGIDPGYDFLPGTVDGWKNNKHVIVFRQCLFNACKDANSSGGKKLVSIRMFVVSLLPAIWHMANINQALFH